MKKRSEVPPKRMVQQDLFATVKPPPPPEPQSHIVAAAVEIEKVRRKRSEIAAPPPFVTGPISDATGGPLSAEEAERVVTLRSIRCSGFQWQDGTACCKACFDSVVKNGDDRGHGYRGTLYGGAEYKGGLTCFACRKPIIP